MLLLGRKVGCGWSWGGCALGKDIPAFLCSDPAHVASPSKDDPRTNSRALCRGFHNHTRQPTHWCRGLGRTTSYWHPGAATIVKLSGCPHYNPEFASRLIQHELRGYCRGVGGACPDPPECCQQETEHRVVDLRSDTVTRPSPEMRQAMAQAEVGDDDYGEDPTVNELQNVVADLLGKEAAVFVPTATMANLIAVMCHCHRRGAQLLLGREAHIHVFEHGGVAQVAGVHSETLQDMPDGTIDLDELERKIQRSYRSQYHPRPELICLENTHCSAGGRVLPLQYLQEIRQLAHRYGLKIHLDGARVLNAAVALGVAPTHIAQHCDSISLCLSKGVGAPAGALLAGRREFIVEAWRVRKLLGGGMRQAGVLAAAALVGLRHMEETLQRDHKNAKRFAEGVCNLGSPLCSINSASVETNIVMMTTSASWLAPAKLCELMEAVSEEEVATTGQAISVRLFPWGEHSLRAVWHCDVSARDTQLAGRKLRFVLDKCEREHARVC